MKRSFNLIVVCVFATLFSTSLAFGQWRVPGQPNQNQGRTPRDGACFYRESGFGGQSFCLEAGQTTNDLPEGFNDRITGIRIYGRASVTVYENHGFSGPSAVFDRSIADLHAMRKRDDPSRTWNDRISSIRVDMAGGGRAGGWGRDRDDRDERGRDRDWDRGRDRDGDRDRDSGYGRGPIWGREAFREAGACFYRERDFGGDYFCLRRGQNYRSLPAGFNDRISSIRLFGGASVTIHQDSDFRGRQARIARNIEDLHDRRTRDDPSRNWNDRISSIQVF